MRLNRSLLPLPLRTAERRRNLRAHGRFLTAAVVDARCASQRVLDVEQRLSQSAWLAGVAKSVSRETERLSPPRRRATAPDQFHAQVDVDLRRLAAESGSSCAEELRWLGGLDDEWPPLRPTRFPAACGYERSACRTLVDRADVRWRHPKDGSVRSGCPRSAFRFSDTRGRVDAGAMVPSSAISRRLRQLIGAMCFT